MTDRELLELAAKAAGIVPAIVPERGVYIDCGGRSGTWWNPLTDDGDALRLAVKLGIDVDHDDTRVAAETDIGQAQEMRGTDPYAATRRAIVRAAAAIAAGARTPSPQQQER